MSGRLVLVTRPAAQAEATRAALAARGFRGIVAPCLTAEPMPDEALDLEGVAALALTSANGAAALAARTRRRDLPVFAVGEATAAAARKAGFASVTVSGGDAAALADLIAARLDPAAGAILHAAAEEAAADLAALLPAFAVRRAVLYRMVPAAALPAEALAALDADGLAAVLFYSARTVAAFGVLVSAAHRTARLAPLAALCLSPAIAETARALPFGSVAAAAVPEEAALLDLLETPGAQG